MLGIVFGFISKRQIREAGGVQQGNGMATAGIVTGIVWSALWLVYIIVVIASV